MVRAGILKGMPAALSATPLAEGTASTFDVTSIMSDAVTSVQGQAFDVLKIVVPAIALVVGAVVCVKFGISWIKKIRG